LGLVSGDGLALVDATPDISQQLRQFARTAGHEPDEPLRAVLLTHLHAGHILGLPLLGREGWAKTRTEVWASEACLDFLEGHEPFARLFGEGHLIPHRLNLGWDTRLGELMIQPVPVPHRSEIGDTLAFRIEGPARTLFYAPDLDALVPEVISQIRAADVALLDGTFFRPGELNRGDAGTVPHPAITEVITVAQDLDTRIEFIHMNHTNPVLDPNSRERKAVEAVGMRITREGDVIELA
jgi:pyrroloquinoline quinone biosynthesis protein B